MINESSVIFKTKFELAVAARARHTPPPVLVNVGDILYLHYTGLVILIKQLETNR